MIFGETRQIQHSQVLYVFHQDQIQSHLALKEIRKSNLSFLSSYLLVTLKLTKPIKRFAISQYQSHSNCTESALVDA